MELDTRTTVVASLIVAALLGGVALGFTGVALRGRIPDFLALVVARNSRC